MGAALVPIAIASTLAGTAVSAFGAIQQANAASAAEEYNAAIARNNAILSQQQAKDARDRGDVDERRERLRTLQAISKSNASSAARGLDVNSGSPLDVAETIAGVGEVNALTIRSNAEREALAFERQRQNFLNESSLRTASAADQRRAGFISAGSTLLSGAGSVAGKWYNFRQSGAV